METSARHSIDLRNVAGSVFDLVQRYDQDGGFLETWCICDRRRHRTVFSGPGASLLASEAPELAWRWQVAQWTRSTDGAASSRSWGEGIHAAIDALTIIAVLPTALWGWVISATEAGLLQLRVAHQAAPDTQQRELLADRLATLEEEAAALREVMESAGRHSDESSGGA